MDMKRFLLVLTITAVVAITIFFIDKYLVEVPFVVLAIATAAAGNITSLVFGAKQKKDADKLK